VLPLLLLLAAPDQTGTNATRVVAPELIYSVAYTSAKLLKTNRCFGDTVNLWRDFSDVDIPKASYAFQSEPENLSATYDLATNESAGGNIHSSRLAVENKALNYSLFTNGDFSAAFNLTPLYLRPQDNMPTEVIPGLSGSFHF